MLLTGDAAAGWLLCAEPAFGIRQTSGSKDLRPSPDCRICDQPLIAVSIMMKGPADQCIWKDQSCLPTIICRRHTDSFMCLLPFRF